MHRFAAALAALASLTSVSAAGKPNIVLVMADDLGYGHLGCYGQRIVRTPRLDRMAAEGKRFTQFYAGSAVCAPSRSVLMTGLHGGHTPVRGNTGGIPLADEDVTMAEVLKSAGYATALFGKWGLGEHGTTGVPYKQGFDEFFGYLHQIHAHFYYPTYLWKLDRRYKLDGNDGHRGQYAHDVIVDRAIDYVRRRARREPFFLYVPVTIPHYEMLAPEPAMREYAGRFEETPYGTPRSGYPNGYAAQPMPRAATAAMITRLDASIGRLLDAIADAGVENDTLVLFTSDNGPTEGPSDSEFFQASGGLRGIKRMLYEGGIRVPAIARWPGRVEAGSVEETPGYFADLLPTFAELAGARAPGGLDGISYLPAILGGEMAERRHFYWEHEQWRAVRDGDWKGVIAQTGAGANARPGPLELYNLRDDPGETRDLAAEHPDLAARLRALIEREHVEPRAQIEPEKPEGRRYR